MKRTLAIISILIPLSYLWSDTSTTGNLKLLKPSIGVVDRNRTSGDKLNANFDIIDSSITQLQADILASTNALNTSLQSQINFISVANSTQDSNIDTLETSVSSNSSALTALQLSISTNSVQASNTNYLNLGSSTQTKIGGFALVGTFSGSTITANTYRGQIIMISTITGNTSNLIIESLNHLHFADGTLMLSTFVSQNNLHPNNTNYAVGTDTTTIKTNFDAFTATVPVRVGERSVPIRFSDEGTALTNVTAVDCVGTGVACTASGSTVTMTIAGSSGGGSPSPFQIIVGTLGSVSGTVDIASSNVDGLNEALRRCEVMGLLTISTISRSCDILYKPGVYNIDRATIPGSVTGDGANVRVYALEGSSVVWVPTANGVPIATVYGRLENITLDFGSRANSSRGLVVSSAGYAVVVATGLSGFNVSAAPLTSVIEMIYTDKAYVKATLHNAKGRGLNNTGSETMGPVNIRFSLDSYGIFNFKGVTYDGSTNDGVFLISRSTRTFVELYSDDASSTFAAIEGGNRFSGIVKAKLIVKGDVHPSGLIQPQTVWSALGASSGTVFQNIDIYHDSTDTDEMFNFGHPNGCTSGALINNVNLFRQNSGGTQFIVIAQASCVGTVIKNCSTSGGVTFLVDSGAGTLAADLDNTVGNVKQ